MDAKMVVADILVELECSNARNQMIRDAHTVWANSACEHLGRPSFEDVWAAIVAAQAELDRLGEPDPEALCASDVFFKAGSTEEWSACWRAIRNVFGSLCDLGRGPEGIVEVEAAIRAAWEGDVADLEERIMAEEEGWRRLGFQHGDGWIRLITPTSGTEILICDDLSFEIDFKTSSFTRWETLIRELPHSLEVEFD